MKNILITFLFLLLLSVTAFGQVKQDSIIVKPSPAQAELLAALEKDAAEKKAVADEAALRYEVALLMLLDVRKEEIDKLEFKNGTFKGIKKPKK